MELPVDLVELVIIDMNDPDLVLLRPPTDVTLAIRESLAGTDLADHAVAWVEAQMLLHEVAADTWAQLNSNGELDDPSLRGLPGWITQWWAPVLQMPWSHRLAEALADAGEWLESNG